MSDIVNEGESIEGLKVQLQSRNPIKNRGVFKMNGKLCYKFVSDFDVRSVVTQEIIFSNHLDTKERKEKLIYEDANTQKDATLICDKAIILSIDNKCSKDNVNKGSGRHNANFRNFPRQTNVKIEIAHQEIKNAQSKKISSQIYLENK